MVLRKDVRMLYIFRLEGVCVIYNDMSIFICWKL